MKRPRHWICADRVSVVPRQSALSGQSWQHLPGRLLCSTRGRRQLLQEADCGRTTVCKKTNFIKTEHFSFQIVNLSVNVTHVVV